VRKRYLEQFIFILYNLIPFASHSLFVALMINEFELFTADIQSRSLSSTPAVITEAEKNRIKMKNDEVT
jgi:hypothetical protein